MSATPQVMSVVQGLVVAWPLVLALALGLCAAGSRRARVADALVPWAAAPALALWGWDRLAAPLEALSLPWLLLGVELGLTPTTRPFLMLTALLWLVAGVHARGYLHDDPRRGRFERFALVTLAGHLALVLARDVATFYLGFAVMTFAAYGLVVHSRTAEARRAGRVYVVLAVLGEAALLAGFVLAAQAAGSLALAELPGAVGALAPPLRTLVVVLLFVGFGVKAGALALHVWLPLAHPVAPTPASAVLSGAMIKAGLLGWLQFLPLGAIALPDAGATVAALGLAAAFYAAVAGVAQDDPKTVLAYSSVSQMGLITVPIGAALADAAAAPVAIGVATVYALHHGFAKSALFLGVASATDARLPPGLKLAGLVLPALALAGAPFTSGALAKTRLADAIGGLPWYDRVEPLLYLAAICTTLLMARFLHLVLARRSIAAGEAAHELPWRAHGAWLAAVGIAAAAGWTLAPAVAALPAPGALWSAAWPVLAGTALATMAIAVAGRAPAPRWTTWRVLPGDLLAPVTRAGPALARALRTAGERPWERLARGWARVESGWWELRRRLTLLVVRAERRARATASAMSLVVLLALLAALMT